MSSTTSYRSPEALKPKSRRVSQGPFQDAYLSTNVGLTGGPANCAHMGNRVPSFPNIRDAFGGSTNRTRPCRFSGFKTFVRLLKASSSVCATRRALAAAAHLAAPISVVLFWSGLKKIFDHNQQQRLIKTLVISYDLRRHVSRT